MKTGTVKFWHAEKKYGFIKDVDGTEYYTYQPLLAEGVTKLLNDQHVCFEVEETPKGKHAINVKPI